MITGLSLATHAQSTQSVLKLPNDIDFKAPVGPGTQNAVLYGDPTSTGIEADVRASPLRDNSPRWGAGDPIHQVEIIEHFPIAKIGNVEIAFTNSALFMLIAVAIIALLMIGATSRRAMVPGRFRPRRLLRRPSALRAAEAIAVLPLPRLSLSRIQAPGSACLAQRR